MSSSPWRLKCLGICIYLGLLFVTARLFYWQVIKGTILQAAAQDQYQRTTTIRGKRGELYTADNYLLVGNQTVYRVFAQPHELQLPASQVVEQIFPYLVAELPEYQEASETARLKEIEQTFRGQLLTKLESQTKWTALLSKVSEETKAHIEALQIHGLGLEPYEVRYYPEASLAAHVTGFVGKDEQGYDTGYFGVEGALDKELQAKTEKSIISKDALGLHLWDTGLSNNLNTHGRNVVLTIRRDVQLLLENSLQKGVERYGAKSGEIIVMEPRTGKIVGMAAWPKYDQATFYKFDPSLYKNPSFAATYEPGSTFKTLTVAAGIDTDAIKPDTECPICEGPRQIGKYSIKTWNNQYNPNITMTDALAKSDNTAMMYITDLLGADVFQDYVKKFGIGDKTYVDIQEDTATPFPSKWGPVELATASFGQGISSTSMQIVRAVATIANRGVMMRPLIVEKVVDPQTNEEIEMQPSIERTVLKPETSTELTQMMISAAEHGEAQWIAGKSHIVAGKTGTSQVAVDGTYDPDKTIATFIGFAPANDPQFIMLVKLVEPQSSPWAAETAAPLWYSVADRLYLLLNIRQ